MNAVELVFVDLEEIHWEEESHLHVILLVSSNILLVIWHFQVSAVMRHNNIWDRHDPVWPVVGINSWPPGHTLGVRGLPQVSDVPFDFAFSPFVDRMTRVALGPLFQAPLL